MATDPLENLELRDTPDGVELALKVVPGASRTHVAGVLGGALKVAVAAPPEGGKANAAVTRLLADVTGLKRSAVSITSGQSVPHKRVRMNGFTAAALRQALRIALG